MRTYTQDEILEERSKIYLIWLKSAFITSTIILIVYLYSISKIIDSGKIYNLLLLFSALWLLPQLIGILTHKFFSKQFKYYAKLHTGIALIAQFPILISIADILKFIGMLNIFTLFIAWLYLLLEILLYASWQRNRI